MFFPQVLSLLVITYSYSAAGLVCPIFLSYILRKKGIITKNGIIAGMLGGILVCAISMQFNSVVPYVIWGCLASGILTDAKNKTILDILPNRKEQDLKAYFSKFKNREDVQYFVCDMNPHFRRIAKCCFPNAKIVVDRCHVSRQIIWAMESVRKTEQKKTSNCSVHISNAPENFLTKKIYPKRICGSLPLSLKMLRAWQKLTV